MNLKSALILASAIVLAVVVLVGWSQFPRTTGTAEQAPTSSASPGMAQPRSGHPKFNPEAPSPLSPIPDLPWDPEANPGTVISPGGDSLDTTKPSDTEGFDTEDFTDNFAKPKRPRLPSNAQSETTTADGPGPTDVMASEGTYRDRVVVTWSPMEGVSRYRVSRRAADSAGQPVSIGEVWGAPRFEDRSVAQGEFEYQVSAGRADSWSQPSAPALGWRATMEAPANLFATDRTMPDSVYVYWDPVNGAASYEVHRTTLQHTGPDASIDGVDQAQDTLREFVDTGQEVLIFQTSETKFNDTDVKPSVYYAYRARAVDSAGGLSGFSPWDRGSARRLSKTLTAPEWVRATQGVPGRIVLQWQHSEDRPGYEIWRSEQPDVFWAKVIDPAAKGSVYTDVNVEPGVTYYYWLRSGDGGRTLSPFSPVATGFTAPAATPAATPLPPTAGPSPSR